MGELVDRDQEHLNLLKIGFYILAGVSGLFSLIPLLYVGLGAIFASGAIPVKPDSNGDPRFIGLIFVGLGFAFLLMGMTMTILTYLVGRSLGERRRRTLCIVVSGLWCLWIPFGSALGICAIMVLVRPSVQALFDRPPAPPVPASPAGAA